VIRIHYNGQKKSAGLITVPSFHYYIGTSILVSEGYQVIGNALDDGVDFGSLDGSNVLRDENSLDWFLRGSLHHPRRVKEHDRGRSKKGMKGRVSLGVQMSTKVGRRTDFLSWMVLSPASRAKNFCFWSLNPPAVTDPEFVNPSTMAFCSSVLNCEESQSSAIL
jgi:hypothetical protein